MDKERRETVVKEIKYWKENRLLPAHYCDYLLALYTGGKEEETIIEEPKQEGQRKNILFVLLAFLMIPISLSCMYIFTWSFTQTVFLLSSALIIVYIVLLYIKKNNPSLTLFPLMVLLLQILLLAIYSSNHPILPIYMQNIVIAGVFLLWFLFGLRYQSKIVSILSAVLLVLSIGVIVFKNFVV